jgi:ABC-2 type transport system permease protein
VRAYFNSPIAYIVLVLFIVASMLCFFTFAKFFSANRAEIRGFFRYVPLIFLVLVPGLTMRLWSEEKKLGTLEILMTLPVREHQFVLGKFLGAWFLVAVALLCTIPIPFAARLYGPLDLGPVVGGYLAAVLLGGAVVAIGTFMSSLTENQIVALLGAIMAGIVLYLPGTELFGLLGEGWVRLGRAVGLGARFESIERGVVDFRDLLYYVSVIVVFLSANVVVLKARRWA